MVYYASQIQKILEPKGSYFLQRHVVASSKISDIASLLLQRTGHPFLYLCIFLPRTSIIRNKFACFCTDGALTATSKLVLGAAAVLLIV